MFSKVLKSKTVSGQELLEDSVLYTTSSKVFDTNIDEEAEKFELNLEVQATGVAYSTEDLRIVLETLIKEIVPKNFEVNENKDEYNIVTTVKEKLYDDETNNLSGLILTNKIQSYVVPEINIEDISNNLTGMTLEEAQTYLSGLTNISEATITTSTSNLPEPLRKLPQRSNSINVEITGK